MPRTINTLGIPENLVSMFMRRIVGYEREIGAELDEGHIALARFMFLARIDTMTANVTIQAPTEADLKKWIEESILETLAAGPGPGTITRAPAVWLTDEGRAFGKVSDEQIEAVLLHALADVRKRSGLASADDATIEDYKEVLADKALLTRELDVLLNGEAGAAKQASLCDIVGQVRIDSAELRAVLVNYYPDCMPPHGSVIKWARDAIERELSKPQADIVHGRILDMHMDRDGHIRVTAAFPKGDELRASLKSMITPDPVPMYTTKPETLGLWKDAPELQKWLEQRYPKLRPEHGNLFSWALAAFEQAPYSWPPGVSYIDRCEYDRDSKEVISLTIKKGDKSTVFVPQDGFPELTAVVHIEYADKAGFKMQWVPQKHRPLEGATLYIDTRNLVPIR